MQKVQILDSDIENLQKDFEIIKSTINFNSLLDELNSIKKMIEQEKDFSSISNLMMRKSELEKKLEKFENVRRLIEDAQVLYEMESRKSAGCSFGAKRSFTQSKERIAKTQNRSYALRKVR
jgi:hypothetical protein